MALAFPFKQNPIYKINLLTNENTISTIIVFYGKKYNVDNPEELFKKDPKNKAFIDLNTGNPIFTDSEISNIQGNNIDVKFSSEEIHFDDTIWNIKLKIIKAFSKTFSIEEMYLYGVQKETVNTNSIFGELTQNGRLVLTKLRLQQFLSNIIYDNKGEPITFDVPDQESYSYDDVMALDLNNKEFGIAKVIGQRFYIVENEYPFIVNPFEVTEYDDFIERASRKSLTTLNSNLLLNTGDLIGNNMYLCLATNVYETMKSKTLSETYATRIYYPFLMKLDIFSLVELNKQQGKLIDDSVSKLTERLIETYEGVDLFYDMYEGRKTELEYKKIGVKTIHLIMVPTYKVKIPLDVIFKLIHATDASPFIKYNPSSRKENIYRLFADKIAKDGRKIPFLSKANIFKLIRTIGKNQSVTVFTTYNYNDVEYPVICEFEENGNIGVSCEFDNIFPIESIDELLKGAINPIIHEIKSYLEQSGYTIPLFNSIFDSNISVQKMDYQSVIFIDKMMQFDDILSCITSVFIVENTDNTKDIQMRYRRVSNFNKMTSQEAFVVEQVKQRDGLKGEDLLQGLITNYNMSKTEAEDLIRTMVNESEIERTSHKGRIEIKVNPGFKTTITLNRITSLITVSVDNIDNLNYLYILPIYVDSLIRLTQNASSTNVPMEVVNNLCSKKMDDEEEQVIDDIISVAEKGLKDMETAAIEGEEELVYTEAKEGPAYMEEIGYDDAPEGVQNALDLFFNDDSDDDSLMEAVSRPASPTEGGQGKDNVDSESSVSSFDSLSDKKTASSVTSESVQIKPIEKVEIEIKEKQNSDKEDSDDEEEIVMENIQENTVQNVDGLRLNYPNPFQSKMESLEPTLFANKKQSGKFKAYSRSCLHNIRRQPVMLTDEDIERIEKQYPNYKKEGEKNGEIVNYGSNPDQQYYYTCPRYWCMKTNMPISKEDVESGKCGKIIPKDANYIQPGEYVFEFFDESEHGTRENYIQHYPGFLEKKKHAEGLCMPCCFKNWNTKSQMERRKECLQDMESRKDDGESVPKAIPAVMKKDAPIQPVDKTVGHRVSDKEEYIKGPEKTPLDDGRWGYLPMSVQNILREDNNKCQISKTNTNVKPDHFCLLRHGVEVNQKQSFIACIADIKYFGEVSPVPSIVQMKETIIQSIDLDSFVKYQNGDLMSIFRDDEKSDKVDLQVYKTMTEEKKPKLFSKVNMDDENEVQFFKNVVGAFENFKSFLRSNDSQIDYTYLWDIICNPNTGIFPTGINLVILEIPNTDSTDNIELLCPTNHYSKTFYDINKKTVILVKNGDYFEPIYGYKTEKNKLKVTRTFYEYDSKLPSSLKTVFKTVIKPLLMDMCIPLASNPREYTFNTALTLVKMVKLFDKMNYQLSKQIVNYQGKVIYIVVKDSRGDEAIVPCFPSALLDGIDFVYMSEESEYLSYDDTYEGLLRVSKDSDEKIPCKPRFKVVEDEMVIGILTDTNQFIQIDEPVPLIEITDDLEVFNGTNVLVTDKQTELANSSDYDRERVDYINKIKLETNFYNVFRNTVRILLNRYVNLEVRENIEAAIKDLYMMYETKLVTVKRLLKDLIGNDIIFTDEYDYNLLKDISTCIVLEGDKCNENQPLCAFTTGNTCQMILPKKNILNGLNNDTFYFSKMADELIRYSRINAYIFNPQTYMSFGKLGYNLRKDEIIVLQSLITQEYFDGLEPAEINEYAKYNTYDDAEPIMSQTYENRVDEKGIALKEITEEVVRVTTAQPEEVVEEIVKNTPTIDEGPSVLCVPQFDKKITSKVWKTCFPSDFGELVYDKNIHCGFYLIIDIIKTIKDISFTVSELKRELVNEYSKYTKTSEQQVLDVLITEGKKVLGEQVKKETIKFKDMIFNDNYFITNLDIRVMMIKFQIPSMFISTKPLPDTNYEKTESVIYGTANDLFVFIACPAFRAENIPKYKIIQSIRNEITFPINILINSKCKDAIDNALDNKKDIENYITSFVKPIIKKKTKKQKLVLQEDDENPSDVKEEVEAEITIIKKKTAKKRSPSKKNSVKRKLKIEE